MADQHLEKAAELLWLARIRCGISLRAAAELQGISAQRLNDIEQGKVGIIGAEASLMLQRLESAANTGTA